MSFSFREMLQHYRNRYHLRWEWLIFAVGVVVAALVAALGSGDQAQTLFSICLFVVLAYAWNVISGMTGYVSFGQVSFFGVGAYVAAFCQVQWNMSWYLAALVAMVAGCVLAIPLGVVMLRLQGIFFALGMLGLARIGQLLATTSQLTGGSQGEPVPDVGTTQETALIMLVIAVCAVLLTWRLLRARQGLYLMAIHDDEMAAKASGINTNFHKVVAFCVSASLAALAGGLYIWNIGFIDPGSAFNSTIDLQTVLMVLIGGIGTLWGPLLGAIIISLVGQALWAQFPQEQQIILGVLTFIAVIWMPGGIVSLLQRRGWLRRMPVWGTSRITGEKEAGTAAEPTTASPTSQEGVLLTCEHLTKRFGGLTALTDFSLEATAGQVIAVIGPNGAGKTTMFNLITGFDRPTSGIVRLQQQTITHRAPHRIACSGVTRTFQTSRPFPSLTAWETLLLAATARRTSKKEALTEASHMLDKLGLSEMWDRSPEHLPPGQQRLLEIGRALMLHPRVLLLDEAMAGMAPGEIALVHKLLKEVVDSGCSVIAIEHVLPAITPIADRIYVLDFGVTIAEGTPQEVLNNPAVVDAYLGTGDKETINA